MKQTVFIRKFILIGLMLGLIAPLLAQNLYLPASTKSKEAKALYIEALNAFYDVDWKKGHQITDKALEADPNFFMGFFNKTFTFDKSTRESYLDKMVNYKGRLNKAEKVIKEIAVKVKADPKYNSIEDWERIEKMYPKNVFPKGMMLMNMFGDEEKYDEALTLIDEMLALHPDLPSAYNSRGYTYLSKKDYDNALKAFDKYIELDPELANPYDSKGDYFMAVKEYDKAAASFKKACEINSDFTYSKKKAEQAEWMLKREKIASEVDAARKEILDAYNARDIGKYVKMYFNSPEFCYIVNGEKMENYNAFVKQMFNSYEKYKSWNYDVLKQNIEIPADNIATVNHIFMWKATSVEGEESTVKGSYTTILRKINDKWVIVQAINVFPLGE